MSFKFVDLVQGTEEWLAYRKTKIPASEVSTILGNSPYKTRRELYFEMKSNENKIDTSKEYIFSLGHAVEELIRQEYFQLTGVLMKPVCVESLTFEDMFASLDGHYEEEGRIIEAKLVGKDAIENARKGIIPQHHIDQLQTQMLITSYGEADYFCHDGKKSGVVTTVKADVLYQNYIWEEVQKFKKLLAKNTPPEMCDRDVLKIEDKETREKFQKLREAKKRLDAAEKEYEQIAEEIKTNPPHARVECDGILLTRVITSGNVDYKKIPELKNIDLEQYRGPSRESWRLNFPKEA